MDVHRIKSPTTPESLDTQHHEMVTKRDGSVVPFDPERVRQTIARIVSGYEHDVDQELIYDEVYKHIFRGINTHELEDAFYMATSALIERDPAYSKVAARFLRQKIFREVIGRSTTHDEADSMYRQALAHAISVGVEAEYFDQRLAQFDMSRLQAALVPERDELFDYIGLYTLQRRYFRRHDNRCFEVPQTFWMRVAMGLALDEPEGVREEKAIAFYHVISKMDYMPSTPTLFHAGFPTAQLSSCYLNTVNDDMHHIFKCFGDNAQMAKWAGGIGTDWTNIRGTGAFIRSIKATGQGVVPYLKIANDVVAAITRSGIRRGGKCAYLETWHYDVEDFLDLRRNTGDERRRTHDMNTANWVPDLFMKRARNDEMWTLFSPHEVPDLHDLYGQAFEKRYVEYEAMAERGEIMSRKISAKQLWRKMLTRLFETGHPWITFKDPSNVRSPQDHQGVVHSSNLCTEITLNTSEDETAVCNLGSINCATHIHDGQLQDEKLKATVTQAVRMLDNVIDLNFYPTKEARTSNMRHRPVGLGIMGFQDALYKMDIPFSSEQAREFADALMEKVSYYAITASAELARERGAYETFSGSKWDRGIFPIDTIDLLEQERGESIDIDRTKRMPWDDLKAYVKQHGVRNSNIHAIAPTATISTIAGCYPSIEPIYKNMYVKSNISGEFTIINAYLVDDLKQRGLWDTQMYEELKFYDGECGPIERMPDDLKEKYRTAFDLDPEWLIRVTAARGKWIDQSQSHNVFMKGVSGKKLNAIYMTAFACGMKTTYYLRTLGASQIEKSTLDQSKYGATQKREESEVIKRQECALNPQECESCQ